MLKCLLLALPPCPMKSGYITIYFSPAYIKAAMVVKINIQTFLFELAQR